MKKIVFLLLLCPLFFLSQARESFRVMFYNVENLFDTEDDPEKNDNDFLPDTFRRWTPGRYWNKLNNIAKVITAAGEWDSPALIGLCEVENVKVMNDLTKYSLLKTQKYRYIMTDSEDERGIDVALMYQRDRFRYIGHENCKIILPDYPKRKTRDVLHVTGQIISGDTLDIFVCHFPSRRGGEQQSESNRTLAATVVRSKVDSLMRIRSNPNILIMGDFNDEPSNKSIIDVLNAKPVSENIANNQLYNLFYYFEKQENTGSFRFREKWNMLDQIIISGNLLNGKQSFYLLPEPAGIFDRNFLLVEDKTNGGKRPKKSYHGMKHEGGFSDHLPVFADFFISSEEVK